MKSTYDFDFNIGDFQFTNGKIQILSGKSALRLWIDKCLRTQFNRYKIYNGTHYGANIEDLIVGIGNGKDFAESELKREIKLALTRNDDIYDVVNFGVSYVKNIMTVSFTVISTYGELEESYDI